MLKRWKSALVHGDEIFSTSEAAAAVCTFTRREISSAHPFDHTPREKYNTVRVCIHLAESGAGGKEHRGER
jgi:hypothetical protein